MNAGQIALVHKLLERAALHATQTVSLTTMAAAVLLRSRSTSPEMRRSLLRLSERLVSAARELAGTINAVSVASIFDHEAGHG